VVIAIYLVILVAAFYFLIVRPQRRNAMVRRQLLNAVEVGDEIVTTAGIYGTITDIDDDYGIVTVEIAPNTDIRMARAAIAQRLVDDDEFVDVDEDEVEGAEPGS
jgi:preprotein translocase subunit YajC